MKDKLIHYELNLAQRPFVNTTVPMILAAALVAGVILFSAFNTLVLISARSGEQEYQQEISAADKRMNALRQQINGVDERLTALDVNGLRQELLYSNTLITRRSMSWTRLFDRLEEIAPPDLRMLRISPTVQNQQIAMVWRVQAPTQGAVRNFIDALEQSPYFDNIELVSEAPVPEGGSEWEMRLAYNDEP